jgi:hypothetical protein
MPRDTHDSPDFDSLRQAVQAAASKVGYPKLHLFCHLLHYSLDIGPDALKRYGEGGTGRINIRDAQRLAAFFHDTDIGRALAGEDALSIRMTEPLLRAFRTAAQSANGHSVKGPYAIYHGSFMYPEHYAKLAATFTIMPLGAVWGDIRYWDNRAAEPAIREAISHVIYRRSCLQMLSLNSDNAEGLELIVGIPSASSSGVVQEIVGTVQGMNLRGEASRMRWMGPSGSGCGGGT